MGALLIGLQNHVFDEHTRTLQIYWSDRDVIAWLAANSDDDHLKKVHRTAEQNAVKMEVVSGSVHDEKALFEEDDDDDEIVLGRTSAKESPEAPPVVETSKQRLLSMTKVEPIFEGLKTPAAGHKIQEIKELMSVPVRIFYAFPRFFLLMPKPSGHCYGRFDQESPSHQGLQRQPLRQNERQEELNIPHPTACFPIPRYSFPVVLLSWLRYSRIVDPSRPPRGVLGSFPNISLFVFPILILVSYKLKRRASHSLLPFSYGCFFLANSLGSPLPSLPCGSLDAVGLLCSFSFSVHNIRLTPRPLTLLQSVLYIQSTDAPSFPFPVVH